MFKLKEYPRNPLGTQIQILLRPKILVFLSISNLRKTIAKDSAAIHLPITLIKLTLNFYEAVVRMILEPKNCTF